jgi:hypothetical protein
MIDYFERKLNWLRNSYNKDEFVRVYALAIRESDRQPKETVHAIAKLFATFVDDMKVQQDAIHAADQIQGRKSEGFHRSPSIKHETVKYDQPISIQEQKDHITNRRFEKEYKDKNDDNNLQWGGVRSSSRIFDHPMRSSPMFFRRNGMPVDLINTYQNSGVFIINNGPSFRDVDKTKLKQPGIITYGINNGAQVFRPDIWSCVDDPTRFLESIWADPKIMKLIPQAHFEKPIWDTKKDKLSDKIVGDFANIYGFRRNEKFDEEKWLFEDTINWGNHKDHGGGRSIMVATLKICYLLGFKRIYLLGCDFEMSEEKKYWFDEQRTKGAIKNNNNSYEKMIEYFTKLKPRFEELGIKIYNLNPDSKLRVFEFMDFDEAIEREKVDTSQSTYGMYVKRD